MELKEINALPWTWEVHISWQVNHDLPDTIKAIPRGVNFKSARNCIEIIYPNTMAYDKNAKHIDERTLFMKAEIRNKPHQSGQSLSNQSIINRLFYLLFNRIVFSWL